MLPTMNEMNKLILIIVTLSTITSCYSQDLNKMGLFDKKKNKIEHKDLELKYDLIDSNFDKLIELEIGEINLPTGKIIASDPFFTKDVMPFSRTVEPGKYPVKIYIIEIEPEHYRIAFAKIKFKNEKAISWILAVSNNMNIDELTNLKKDEYFGFPVDAGLGCFLDDSTNYLYNKKIDDFYTSSSNANYYNDLLAQEFKDYSSNNEYSSKYGDWNNHLVEPNKGLNVIMFASGWGDGYYPTYWGYNDNKETVELTIDFLIDFED